MEKTYGWTGKLLRIELPSGEVSKADSMEYAGDFIGGRMLASRIYWDEVSKDVGALDPENVLMVMTGPLTGTQATACSRWVISAKSPHSYPDQYGFGNAGGFLGAALKHAGYDGLIIKGKAKAPSYLFIENDKVELKDANGLWGLASGETMKRLKKSHGNDARVVCIGPAGENMVRFAIASTDQGGALSNGMGAVMGSKNIKAVVVRGSNKVQIAQPERLSEVNKRIRFLRKGVNERVYMTEPMIEGIDKIKAAPCYSCPAGCSRSSFKHTSGLTEVRKGCASAYFYVPWDQLYHGKATENPFIATSLCDRYGLCTGETANVIHWLYECFKKGILSDQETGLPLSKIGSLEFIEALVDQVVNKKGFGELLAQGTRRASIEKGKEAEAVALTRVTPSGYINDAYGARVFLITALFYATETKNPVIQNHEVNFLLLKWALYHTTAGTMSPITVDDLKNIAARAWGGEVAVDFSTYEGKAKAAFMIQNRQHAKESMVACDRFFPLLDTDQEEDHMGDPSLLPQLYEAVTGRDLSEDEYYLLGERSVNLQRAIMGREGRVGRKEDTLGEFNFTEPVETSEGVFGMFNPDLELPGAGDEIITRKGKTVDRKEFERMKDEYYLLRGWDAASGMQTKGKLQKLGLDFLLDEMEKGGLLKD
ncbi:MAG: aldehyde ferredoxin oxidoreductase N-terminal domain-containing protein [Thermodesulfobacteriota bacterium]